MSEVQSTLLVMQKGKGGWAETCSLSLYSDPFLLYYKSSSLVFLGTWFSLQKPQSFNCTSNEKQHYLLVADLFERGQAEPT